ncbi:MAG: ABC transporter permease [Chelatococcus sp.]|uniref:ABC transporter permease n=1 Tax=unclassified Chelatococcus TaxID=2638111 RepID=UPI001BCF6FBB|nr:MULTISPECIES: ABC transporter permease [unclassified Chelatococcus]CAH1649832.1 Hydroxymethylpyrimidine ABC transporter, transmembrane component [Hyphomicrobiales bacterium]MBS7743390.1 ABC transporter permease [Chelatococcus sp. HY11]MBX3540937.1 ABC transporter permease [Chelatococcus sp.]MBX3541492.1 ABC transporter permease [Chelatococcus sp.]MCO5074615.1 ABC transporter permease [Chelatococcus sp.]
MDRFNRFLPGITIIAILAFWEWASIAWGIKEFILPAPSVIVRAAIENWRELVDNMWTTLGVLAAGYAVGVIFGVGLAILMMLLPPVRSALYPLIVASQTIPKIAIAPLLILWFGVGVEPKIFIIALLAFFPVLINTVTGLEGTDKGHLELMHSVDARFWQVYRHVRLPSAVPHIFAGLKLALTVSVIGAVVGEWVVGNRGLGYLLLAYNASLSTAKLFAALALIVAISAILFYLITRLEKALSWRARLMK